MNITLVKRLEKLELAQPAQMERWLIVPLPEYVPAGFNGRVIVTGVTRHGDVLEAA